MLFLAFISHRGGFVAAYWSDSFADCANQRNFILVPSQYRQPFTSQSARRIVLSFICGHCGTRLPRVFSDLAVSRRGHVRGFDWWLALVARHRHCLMAGQ